MDMGHENRRKATTARARRKSAGKRILAIVMSLVLVVGLMPSMSFAANNGSEKTGTADKSQAVESAQANEDKNTNDVARPDVKSDETTSIDQGEGAQADSTASLPDAHQGEDGGSTAGSEKANDAVTNSNEATPKDEKEQGEQGDSATNDGAETSRSTSDFRKAESKGEQDGAPSAYVFEDRDEASKTSASVKNALAAKGPKEDGSDDTKALKSRIKLAAQNDTNEEVVEASIDIAAESVIQNTAKVGEEYVDYFAGSKASFKVTMVGSSFAGDSYTTLVSVGSAGEKEVKVTRSGDKLSGSFDVAESEARTLVGISAKVKDDEGETISGAYGHKVVVDNTKPSDIEVDWSIPEENVLAKMDDDKQTASFVVSGDAQEKCSLEATITVKDYNLRFPDGVLDDVPDNVIETKVKAAGSGLTAVATQEWKKDAAADEAQPAKYTCKVKFETNSVLADGATFNPELTIAPADWSKNEIQESDAIVKTAKMVIEVDNNPPFVSGKATQNDVVRDLSTTENNYFKNGDSIALALTEKNYADDKIDATIGAEKLEFAGPNERFERGTKIEFGGEGEAESNVARLAKKGTYELAVSGTDAVGNPMASYSAICVYDPDAPTIALSYGEGDEAVQLKTADDIEAKTGEAFIAKSTTVSVTVADDVLDTDHATVKVDEYEAKALRNGEALTVDINVLETAVEGEEHTVTVEAKDLAGNEARYVATFKLDLSVPTLDVVWVDSDEQFVEDNVSYYTKREATITVMDENWDAERAAISYPGGKGESVDGSLKWTDGENDTHWARVVYAANAKECALKASYKGRAQTPSIAPEGSNITVTGGVYEADAFDVIASPVVNVAFNQIPGTIEKDGHNLPAYVLDENGKLTVTLTVIGLAFNDGDYSASVASAPADAASESISWTKASEPALVHKGTLVFEKDCDVSSFAIQAPASAVGSASEANVWGFGDGKTALDSTGKWVYEYDGEEAVSDLHRFVVDATPPTLVNVSLNPQEKAVRDSEGTVYFNADAEAKALVTVEELNLNSDGSPIEVVRKAKDSADDTVIETGSTASPWQYSVPFDAVSGKATAYELVVSGTDLAERALIAGSDDDVAQVMDGGNKYSRTVVIDDEAPLLTVGYTASDSAKIREAVDKSLYSNKAVTANIKVADTFIKTDADPANIVVDVTYEDNSGATGNVTASGFVKDDEGKYSCDVELPAEENKTRVYTVKISGTDAVGNSVVSDDDESTQARMSANEYEATVCIDTTAPELSVVGFDDAYKSAKASEDAGLYGGVQTYYYNANTPAPTVNGSVKDESLILKYDKAAGTGASATITKKSNVVNTKESIESAEFNDVFGTGGFTVSSDQSALYTFEVSGEDAAGNKLVATSGDGDFAAEGMGDGSYKTNVVYDTTMPTVKMTYTVGDSTESKDLAYSSEVHECATATVTATFTDDYSLMDQEKTVFTYEVNGAGAEPVEVTWSKDGAAAIFEVPFKAGELKKYQITVDGKDMAGNPLAGDPEDANSASAFGALIIMDGISPTLKVTYTPNGRENVEKGGTVNEARYYNDSVAATVVVEDACFVAANITIAGRQTRDDEWAREGDRYTYLKGMTFSAEASTDFEISGTDEFGNKLIGEDGSTCVNAGLYKSRVVVDWTNPQVEVTYTVPSSDEQKSLGYEGEVHENQTVSATAHFTDNLAGIDKDATTFTFKLNGTDINVKAVWEDESTASFVLPFQKEELCKYVIEIDGADLAGNPLAGDSSHATEASAFKGLVIIDDTPPTLMVTYESKAKPNVIYPITAEEIRYYNDTVTANIVIEEACFDPAKITIDGNATTESDWTRTPDTDIYTYRQGIEYSKEQTSDLLISGTDKFNKGLVAANMTVAVDRGVYTAKIVVDRTAPTAKVTYAKGSDGENAKELDNGGTELNTTDVYAFVTITDALSFNEEYMSLGEKYRISVKPNAKIVLNSDGSTWKKTGSNTYEAVLLLTSPEDVDTSYEVKVQGKDLAGNEMDDFSGTLVVDKYAPRLNVSFLPKERDVTDESTTREMRYYGPGSTVVATITVTDSERDLDASKLPITVDNGGQVTPLELKQVKGSSHVFQATVTMKAPVSDDVINTIRVSGTDAAGNKLVSSDENGLKPLVSDAGAYKSRVYFDVTTPKLTVVWSPGAAKNGKYFQKKRTATVKVEEINFVPEHYGITVNHGKSEVFAEESDWTRDGDVYTLNTTFEFDESTSDQYLQVSGRDRSYNNLELKSDNTEPNKGATSEGVYTSAPFIVDLTAPSVSITSSQKRSRFFDTTDYFRGKSKFTMKVEVDDANFDYANDENKDLTTVTATGAVLDKGSWDGNAYEVTYGENNASKQRSDLSLEITDLAGNTTRYAYGQTGEKGSTSDSGGSTLVGEDFVVDRTAPKVIGGKDENIPTRAYTTKTDDEKMLFFNKDTNFVLISTDDIGIYIMNGQGGNKEYVFDDDEKKRGKQLRKRVIPLKDGAEFTKDFLLYTEDVAGNNRTWQVSPSKGKVVDVTNSDPTNTPLYKDEATLYPQTVVKDTVDPVITELSGATAGEYYNRDVSIVTSLKELNFRYVQTYDGHQGIVTITKEEGRAGRAKSPDKIIMANGFNAVNKMEGTYKRTVSLTSDGHYTVSAQMTDLAKNKSNLKAIGEFTVDKTAPTVDVSFDNNSSVNGKYYPAGRTATIVVTEHNFDPGLIDITTNGSTGSWSTNGDVHTIRVAFTSDGTYNLSVAGRDLAGNTFPTYTADEFVVDLTAPSITFVGVDNGGAYNGTVVPGIVFTDEANLNSNGQSWTLTGTKNGGVEYASQSGQNGNSFTVNYADFSIDPAYDDIYTINASMSDMAGNSAQGTITFSVNRFGSNFRVMDPEDYKRNDGYLDKRQEVVIQEINVSGCDSEKHGVLVTQGTSVTSLMLNETPRSTGYVIETDTSSDGATNGWASYIYHIAADNFTKDGSYHVSVTSDDRATNKNASSSYYDRYNETPDSMAEVNFILDETPPIITNVNFEDNAIYDTEAYEASFSVVENIGLKDVSVILDGDLVDVSKDDFGNYSFVVPAKTQTRRTVEIQASDFTTRAPTVATVSQFRVTTDLFELHMPLVLGVLALVIAAAAGVTFAVRRRMGSQQEEYQED